MSKPLTCSQSSLELIPLDPIEALEAIHSGAGAVLSFCKKTQSEWIELGSVPLPELREKFPALRPFLDQDVYFSINSTYLQRYGKQSDVTGLPRYNRKALHLRWLNAVAVDLDAGHDGRDFSYEELLSRFLAVIVEQALPMPSLICSSGRGVWALWLLHDLVNSAERVPAFPQPRGIAESVNRAIFKKFAHLWADPRVTDCARVMRVPGSLNSAAGRRVTFFRLADRTYSLPELANAFGLKADKTDLRPERRNEPRNQRRVQAGLQRWRLPLQGFRDLWKLRGRFSRGTRHCAVYYYAMLLRKVRTAEPQIVAECRKLGASCSPALEWTEIERCINSSEAIRSRVSNATLARSLKISPAEKSALTNWFRVKPVRQTRAQRSARISAQIARRRASLAQIRDSAGPAYSLREMERELQRRYSIKASYRTILTDLRELNRNASEASPDPRLAVVSTTKAESRSTADVVPRTVSVKPQLLVKPPPSQHTSNADFTEERRTNTDTRAEDLSNAAINVPLDTSKSDFTQESTQNEDSSESQDKRPSILAIQVSQRESPRLRRGGEDHANDLFAQRGLLGSFCFTHSKNTTKSQYELIMAEIHLRQSEGPGRRS